MSSKCSQAVQKDSHVANRTEQGIAVIVSLALVSAGCAGVRWTVTPAPTSLSMPSARPTPCGAVIVEALPLKHTFKPVGNLAYEFADALEHSGLFEPIYYQRMAGEVDYVLRSKFDARYKPPRIMAAVTSVLIVGTLGILAPVMRYTYRYELTGDVEVYKGGEKVNHLTATTQAEVSTTFTSMLRSSPLTHVLHQAKQSLYRQLIMQLTQYCEGA